jgi:hypothetical protein
MSNKLFYAALAIASISLSSTAWASTTKVTGANGKSATSQMNATRSGNQVNRDRTTTYANGNTSSTNSSINYNSDGSYNGNATHTNRQGTVSNSQLNGQVTKANGVRTNTGTVTNANGSANYVNTRSCTISQCTSDRTTTFGNGTTRNLTSTGIKSGNGEVNGTYTATKRNGNTSTGSFSRSR